MGGPVTGPVVRVAAVNDEPSPTWDLDQGLDVLEQLGFGFVELRAAWGQMVDDMEDETFERAASRLHERGFRVTTYLSQMGQCVPHEANRAAEARRLKRAAERARRLGARQIRLMGYRKGEESDNWNERAVELIHDLTRIARRAGQTLIFENPPNARNAAIGTASECLQVLRAVNSPHLRLNFDAGNFGAHGEEALQAFEMLKGFIVNVHVKDILVLGDPSTYCAAGDGACRYPEIFAGLASMNFSGIVTAEPHLPRSLGHHASEREGFMHAAQRMVALLQEAGFSVVKRAE